MPVRWRRHAGQVGQGGERPVGAAVMVDQRAEGAGADIVAADETQPIQPRIYLDFIELFGRMSCLCRVEGSPRCSHLRRASSSRAMALRSASGSSNRWP